MGFCEVLEFSKFQMFEIELTQPIELIKPFQLIQPINFLLLRRH
jgi:hypothetical protein